MLLLNHYCRCCQRVWSFFWSDERIYGTGRDGLCRFCRRYQGGRS